LDFAERVPQGQEQRIAGGETLDEEPVGAILPLPLLPPGEELVDVLERLERAGAGTLVERVAAVEKRLERALVVVERGGVVLELETPDGGHGLAVLAAPPHIALERDEALDRLERGLPLSRLRLQIEELLQN